MSGEGCGEFLATQIQDGATRRLFIDRADPRILISAAIIEAARSGASPWTSLDGDVLRIEAENRTVVYRIGRKVHGAWCYEAEWPD